MTKTVFWSEEIYSNYSGIFLCGTPLNQNSFSSNILRLINTYNRIYDSLGIVSSLYVSPILVQLTQIFLWFVGFSFTFTASLSSHDSYGLNPFLVFPCVAKVGLYLILFFLRLFIVTITCENLRSENKRLSACTSCCFNETWQPTVFTSCSCFPFNFWAVRWSSQQLDFSLWICHIFIRR
jgi:hypothetical protein